MNLSGWMIEKRETHTHHASSSSTILIFTLTQTPGLRVNLNYFKKRYLSQVLVSFSSSIQSLSSIHIKWHPRIFSVHTIIFTKFKFPTALYITRAPGEMNLSVFCWFLRHALSLRARSNHKHARCNSLQNEGCARSIEKGGGNGDYSTEAYQHYQLSSTKYSFLVRMGCVLKWRAESLLIYKEESLFVCLPVLYAFEHSTCQWRQTFQKSSSHPGEGRQLFFFTKIISPSSLPKDPLGFRPMELQYSVFK